MSWLLPSSASPVQPLHLGSRCQAHVTEGESKLRVDFQEFHQHQRDYQGITMALWWDSDGLIMELAMTWDYIGVWPIKYDYRGVMMLFLWQSSTIPKYQKFSGFPHTGDLCPLICTSRVYMLMVGFRKPEAGHTAGWHGHITCFHWICIYIYIYTYV